MKILILSGSRADFAYLTPIAAAFKDHAEVTLESLVSVIDGPDTAAEVAARAGMILMGGGKTLADLNPDLMLVLGDRWEVAAACIAAVLAGIPIAHIGAGEETRGAYDDKFRASIEALASLHFCLTHQAYARMMGRGILAGCTSVQPPLEIPEGNGKGVVILHPETAGNLDAEVRQTVTDCLTARGIEPMVLGANPDVGSIQFAGPSIAPEDFHKFLSQASIIVGNSSAGIIEAPILCTPSVNIGRRQEGRPRAESVFQCGTDPVEIGAAIDAALAFGKRRVHAPYWHDGAAEIIVRGCLDFLDR